MWLWVWSVLVGAEALVPAGRSCGTVLWGLAEHWAAPRSCSGCWKFIINWQQAHLLPSAL